MVLIQGMACQCQENDDDHDSGTESDDEGADAEELEKYMDDSLHCDGSSAPSDRASSTLDTITDTTTEGGGGAGCSPNLLDSALPSDSDHTFDHHSSEEELEVINCGTIAKYPEKRKWSQANTRLSLGSGSSDEEVRDLMCVSAPVEFRSSPPANVPKPSRSLSPPPKLFHASTTIPPHELCSVSPRKRHRRTLLTTTATATSTNLVEHRPSLDFEKMQQRLLEYWKVIHGAIDPVDATFPGYEKITVQNFSDCYVFNESVMGNLKPEIVSSIIQWNVVVSNTDEDFKEHLG